MEVPSPRRISGFSNIWAKCGGYVLLDEVRMHSTLVALVMDKEVFDSVYLDRAQDLESLLEHRSPALSVPVLEFVA